MTYDELPELHSIMPVENLPSILEHGILSNHNAKKRKHSSIAMEEIQNIRANVVLPTGKTLHSYACLYINARNKMMYKRQHMHRELCVLRVDKRIIQDPRAIVADMNASSAYVRFGSGVSGLKKIDKEVIFARHWTHPGDPIAQMRHGAEMCAEVLLLDVVRPEFITGVYVSNEETKKAIESAHPQLNVTVNSDLFFQRGDYGEDDNR